MYCNTVSVLPVNSNDVSLYGFMTSKKSCDLNSRPEHRKGTVHVCHDFLVAQ